MNVSNTSTSPADQSSQITLGLFFDIQNSSGVKIANPIGMLSATATLGTLSSVGTTTVTTGTQGVDICGSGVGQAGKKQETLDSLCSPTVSNGWEAAYTASSKGLLTGFTQDYAVGDAGWGLFNGGSVGNPVNGLAPQAGLAPVSNGNITGNYPFVYETAKFVLYGLTTQNVTFTNVQAAYGTQPEAEVAALLQTNSAPEPGPVFLMAGGLALIGVSRLRRRR